MAKADLNPIAGHTYSLNERKLSLEFASDNLIISRISLFKLVYEKYEYFVYLDYNHLVMNLNLLLRECVIFVISKHKCVNYIFFYFASSVSFQTCLKQNYYF
jgi:hypothetical protein